MYLLANPPPPLRPVVDEGGRHRHRFAAGAQGAAVVGHEKGNALLARLVIAGNDGVARAEINAEPAGHQGSILASALQSTDQVISLWG